MILIGNKYIGYSSIKHPIREYACYFRVSIGPNHLVEWADNAKHGDKLKLDHEFHGKSVEFLCIE